MNVAWLWDWDLSQVHENIRTNSSVVIQAGSVQAEVSLHNARSNVSDETVAYRSDQLSTDWLTVLS